MAGARYRGIACNAYGVYYVHPVGHRALREYHILHRCITAYLVCPVLDHGSIDPQVRPPTLEMQEISCHEMPCHTRCLANGSASMYRCTDLYKDRYKDRYLYRGSSIEGTS